jgi:DNA invertase Pin-like site-specific DNA recombinase
MGYCHGLFEIANAMGELIGYARVSTREQNLALQLAALEACGCLQIYQESLSASAKKRPDLDAAIKELRPGDTLVVWRLDRLARSMRELYTRLDQVAEQGASFKSLTENFDFTTATGKLILGFIGLMAEFERQLTIERTTAGLQAARARGVDLGAPRRFKAKQRLMATKLLAERHKTKMSFREIARRCGVSTGTIYMFRKELDAKKRK